jgi:translation initiation factor 2B subunit (eIF-2B alpha/beta/delta family)
MDEKRFNQICRDIKSLKIQGARNIAKQALIAYYINHTKKAKEKLISLRPTEPMLWKVLNLAENYSKEKILMHFDDAQGKINKFAMNVINQNDVIFTHCHSTNVVNALIFAKKHGKKFQVYNTETRPLYQGKKTAEELTKSGIKVTMVVEAAAAIMIKKSNRIFFGADAILKNGNVINKVGSGMFAEIAYDEKIPVYIMADSWKFSKRPVEIEERAHSEIWKRAPKHVKIKNPAFETIDKKYVRAIISDIGMLTPLQFVRKASNLKI